MPLDEEGWIGEAAKHALAAAEIVIGENRKVAFRYLKQAAERPAREVFFLDPPRDDEWKLLQERLRALKRSGGSAALFSDSGMPVLFDPGKEVLEFCRREGFVIRTVPGPTSWAVAAAASGWDPPFLVHGFLPREEKERERSLRELAASRQHVVLLETPYRFRLLLRNLAGALGSERELFLAWEIGKSDEWLWWGTAGQIEKAAAARGLQKGEFILAIKSPEKRK